MQFYGTEMIFDNKSSKDYGLIIASAKTGSSSHDGIGGVSVITDRAGGSYKQKLLGVEHSSPLTFDISLYSEEPIEKLKLSSIQNWLVAKYPYRRLKIVQPDMEGLFFNCIITGSKVEYIGNVARGIVLSFECDSPWAYEDDKVAVLSGGGSFDNQQDHYGYLIPSSMEITCSGGDVKIINTSDNNRTTSITGMNNGDVVTLNEELGLCKSSRGVNILDNFNCKFPKFINGQNALTMQGVRELRINYNNIRKIGG